MTQGPVPIAPALKKVKGDGPNNAPLLLKREGTAWQQSSTVDYRDPFRRAVEQANLNPGEITCNALRHSSMFVRCWAA